MSKFHIRGLRARKGSGSGRVHFEVEPIERRVLLSSDMVFGGLPASIAGALQGQGGPNFTAGPASIAPAEMAAPFQSSGLPDSVLRSLYGTGWSPRTSDLADLKTGPLADVGAELLQAYRQYAGGGAGTGGMLPRPPGAPVGLGAESAEVIVHVSGAVESAVSALAAAGMSGLSFVDAVPNVLQGRLPLAQLPRVAGLPGVLSVNAVGEPVFDTQGIAPNQGDSVLSADAVRSIYGLSGAGVKIGVISNSVNRAHGGLNDSVLSGDLPNNVQVLQDGSSISDDDEGRAMLEEIHDIAPHAALAFATSEGGMLNFANNIAALQSAGCKIIVDDASYFAEPMFQDGVISNAITSFVKNGGFYFSSAGNSGDSGYERATKYVTLNDGSTWIDFAGSGFSPDPTLTFTTQGGPIYLQWDNPYNGVTGAATADMDMFVYNLAGNLIASSTSNNLFSGFPLESVTLAAGTYQLGIRFTALFPGATAPALYRFISPAKIAHNLTSLEWGGLMGSTFGHNAGVNTLSVGAVPYTGAPPFSNPTPVRSENFSSSGPVIYVFDSNGVRLPSAQPLNKPDFSSVDGVDTSFFGSDTDFDGLPNFFGTSAAAPNAAAVAALLVEYDPAITPAQLYTALQQSTTALNGSAAGVWDAQGGYGLINAPGALGYFSPTIASLGAAPSPATMGSSVTLTANNVVDAHGTLSSVRFYRESNGVSGLQTGPGGDLLVDTDTSSAGGWSVSAPTTGLAPGNYTYYAQAVDSSGPFGAVGLSAPSAGVSVVPADAITGTSGNDTVSLTISAQNLTWSLNGGAASGQLPVTDPNGLTVNCNGGNDVITLDYTNGNPLPNLMHLSSGAGSCTINNLQGAAPLAGTTLDIGRSTVFINYATPSADAATKSFIKQCLAAGYNGGAWNGNSADGVITSIPARNNSGHNTAIGWADSSDATGTNGTPNTIELKYTLNGDTNLNGTVDIFDLNNLLPHYNHSGDWTGGDFTYNGGVDIFDLNAMLPNYNTSLGSQVVAGTSAAATTATPSVGAVTAKAISAGSHAGGESAGLDWVGRQRRKKR